MRPVTIALSIAFALSAAGASAATLYKLTDSQGRVTYVDSVPQGYSGAVQRMDIDTGEHVIPLQEPVVRSLRSRAENEEIIRRSPPDTGVDRVRAARLKAAAARSALESAQNNSTPEEWIYFPGGRAPRPEYEARLAHLEREVQAAKEALRDAERG